MKNLEEVQAKVDEVLEENAELKAGKEAAEAGAAEAQTKIESMEEELKSMKEANEELEAKAAAPAFITPAETEKKELESRQKDVNEFLNSFARKDDHDTQTKAANLQISTDSQGGYALPEELRQEIIMLEHEMSPLRQEVSVRSADTTDVKQLVSVGGAASGWVGETAARGNTGSPELAQRIATFGEVYANPIAYQHVLEDAFFDVQSWLMGEVARQFAEEEGVAFLSGNGTDKPVGILNGLTLTASGAADDVNGTFEVINDGVDGALGATDTAIIDNLRNVILSVKTGYLPGSKWMMNRATHNVLASLQDANGQYYINRDVANAAGTRFLGYDIVINEDMADIPATTGNAAPILFGNFKRSYQVVDRVGVSMLRDPYTTKGAVQFYTRKRVGSMLLDVSALKVVAVSKV
jgi:HK97 family phage major capsid protein